MNVVGKVSGARERCHDAKALRAGVMCDVACESFQGLHRRNNVLLSVSKSIVDMFQMRADFTAPSIEARSTAAEYP